MVSKFDLMRSIVDQFTLWLTLTPAISYMLCRKRTITARYRTNNHRRFDLATADLPCAAVAGTKSTMVAFWRRHLTIPAMHVNSDDEVDDDTSKYAGDV